MVNEKSPHSSIDLNDALDSIATAFHFDADALIEYAALDPHGGYHDKYDDGFPTGSVWRVEGQILYALVRALIDSLPDKVVFHALELGTHHGCSATHILQAIADSGGGGTLTCVDLNGAAGNMIPSRLLTFVEFVRGDMFDYLAQQKATTFDFILEDGSHNMEDVEKVWRAAWSLLKPGGVIISHDAEHFHIQSGTGVGQAVREGIARAGFFGVVPPARTYKVSPSDCGFAIWRDTSVHEVELPGDVLVIEPNAGKRKNDELPTVAELMTAPDLSAMTIAELKQYADKRGIELPASARTKGAIIAAIEAAL
jgi:predicted O-methyltransferase YrrM